MLAPRLGRRPPVALRPALAGVALLALLAASACAEGAGADAASAPVALSPPVPTLEQVRDAARRDVSAVAASGVVAVFDVAPGTDCPALVEGPATNLLPNPSAEVGTDEWDVWRGTLTWDGAPPGVAPRYGAHTVRVEVGSPEGSAQTPPAHVDPGSLYSASVWAHSPGTTLCLGLNHYTADGEYLRTGPCGGPVALGEDWQRLTLPAVAVPPDTGRVSLYVALKDRGATFWVDGAQIEPGPTVTSYLEGHLGISYAWAGEPTWSPSTRADVAGVG